MKRKEKILEILQERERITVKELSNIFKVSEMTIYRDIKGLEKEGKILREHGSVILNKYNKNPTLTIDTCPICSKPITRSHPYRIILKDNTIIEACCEHCGILLHQNYKDEEVSAITYDFITENPITSFNAYFVVGSLAIPCCSPSVIPFANIEDAKRFSLGFGGDVLNFIETYERLTKILNMSLKNCCNIKKD